MAKLWEKDLRYSFLRLWCDCNTRRSYCKTTVKGDIPKDGAVIIAPNHTNTLMDALVVLRTRKSPTAFGARADIFKKPAIARFLRLIKIVPMARSRDGSRAVLQNLETFSEVDEVLEHQTPFCVFSEGRHRPKHSLLPIQKGIARIAFASAAKRQTYVVPTGIEYGDYFHYRTTCDIRFGEPIDVNAFLQAHEASTEAETFQDFRNLVHDRIAAEILYIPDDENYKARLAEVKPPHKTNIPLAAVLSPLFLVSAVLCLPLWAGAEYICRRKLKDPAWRNTVRAMFRLFGMPLMVLLWIIVLPGWWKLLGAVLTIFSYGFFYDWLNLLPWQGIEVE